jgi:hypothetical protein
VESIRVRLAPGIEGSSYLWIILNATQAAASRPATMPLLAFNRKDRPKKHQGNIKKTSGESIGRIDP